MISVQISEGREALEAISQEWENLLGNTFTSTFSHPAWYLAWMDAFETGPVAMITARVANRLVGILPFARNRSDARGLYLTRVGPLALADYQPPIVAPEFASTALPAMLDAAIAHFGRRGVLWLPHIPTTDPSLGVLRSYFSSHNMPFVEESEIAPRLRLGGGDFASIEQSWSSSHRIDVRRQRKRLAAQGPVSFWQPATVEEAEPVLDEFFRVHDEKWLSQGFPGRFQQPEQRRHFQALLRHLLGRGLHFSTVRCGDINVSYGFGFCSGGWVQWYRPTYRTEFQHLSPGKIHIALLIEEACRLGWQGIDFLLGEEPYKNLWANETQEVVNIHAGFSEWAPSYLWFARGKPYVKQRLALRYMRAQAWVQKWRQRA
jgi:CelD/BcsL family acetyltransferase involved in cellulose biosynthesis